MNGSDLRRALDKEFAVDSIEYEVRTRHRGNYRLPVLEVYVTYTVNSHVYEALSKFAIEWFRQYKPAIQVKVPKTYFQSKGVRFPWPRYKEYQDVEDVEVILGAFAL